jgi:hypothetical protein
MDLDYCSEMIIFETTFEVNLIFQGSRNWLELEIKPLEANLACLNW